MLVNPSQCCGCGSCAAICPSDCIKMIYDDEGFRYPQIDLSRCVHCQACTKGCPMTKQLPPAQVPRAIAAQNQDEHIRNISSSGGIFFALAQATIAQGGRVCAAVYDNDFSVTHLLADTMEDVLRQCGAKYPQSRSEQCFKEIRSALRNGTQVLFVGTPCQTAGLHAFLGRDYKNLILVDMVCHGVVSPKVWTRFLEERRQLDAEKAPLSAVNLRSKTTGWSRYQYSVCFDYANGRTYSAHQGEDMLMRGFTQNLYLRPSCSQCNFKGVNRCADLTLGDYWGIWDQYPDFDDGRGTSLLLIHTPKGQTAWAQIVNRFRCMDTSYNEAVSQNPSAVMPSKPHYARERFFSKLDRKKSVISWIEKCLDGRKPNLIDRIRHRLGG